MPANITPCKEWTKYKDRDGYGKMYLKIDGKNKTLSVHRYFYEQVFGKIPEGKVIDHLCKNRACYNVAHLEVVTVKENTIRGLTPKITERIAHKIRELYKKGNMNQFQLANYYGLNQGHVSKIINGRRWA